MNKYVQVLRSESPNGKCVKLHTVAASNNRDHTLRSLYYCLFAHIYMGVVFRPHPVRGESYIQRNNDREFATTPPPFYNEPHRSHVLFVNASPGTTFTFWSHHHFVVIGKPQRKVRKASHCGSKQQ